MQVQGNALAVVGLTRFSIGVKYKHKVRSSTLSAFDGSSSDIEGAVSLQDAEERLRAAIPSPVRCESSAIGDL